jgi:UDP-arabinose 4-epimerase
MSANTVLVVGGAGFIGSHTSKLLSKQGYEPVVYDNLSTGHRAAVRWGAFVEGDILDTAHLVAAIEEHKPSSVIHFAASAYVGESVENPAKYYRNNVAGTLSLLEACRLTGTRNVVFSSSCATYGVPANLPIHERDIQQPINPYGRTKLIAEHMLADYSAAYGLRFVALRYFNACGADLDGELKEAHDPETHLIPRAMMAAAGTIDFLEVYGNDYDTPDGTCIRDYIHVLDLARAHVLAVERLGNEGANLAVNLGTGRGTSIREILDAIGRITGRTVPVEMRARRAGDPPALYADPSLAAEKLGFLALYSDLDTIIRSAAPTFGLELRG